MIDINRFKKSIKSRVFKVRILIRKIFKSSNNAHFHSLERLKELLADKENITVVCSGPSAKKITPSNKDLYLVTNDSFKLVQDQRFLYYVNDGYFFRRFIAIAPFNKHHQNNIFFYKQEDKLHSRSMNYFLKHVHLLFGDNYLLSNFDEDDKKSLYNYHQFIDYLKEYNIPVKFQNSGIFLLLFGFYLSHSQNKNLIIYGLDLGFGGNVHFNKGGHVGKSITNDRVRVNTKRQLDIIYSTMKGRVKNFSNFHQKVNAK